MPNRSKSYRSPRDWLAAGTWPDGSFNHDAPEDVAVAVAIARALQEALEDRNKSRVASDAGIQRSTLYDILDGRSWPDTATLAKLERELDRGLWPAHPTPRLLRHGTSSRPATAGRTHPESHSKSEHPGEESSSALPPDTPE